MLALGIIILILILILIMPVGADAAYIGNVFSLAAKAGPFKIGILPSKSKEGDEKKAKKEKKPKKDKKAAEKTENEGKKKSGKPKLKLSFEDIMGIVRIGLAALGRFRRSISIDLLMLHLTTAGPDPYTAVMNHGYFNAAIGAALPLLHRAFKVKKEDYASEIDFEADKLKIDARIVLTVRIWEILLIVFCAAYGFIKWLFRRRRKAKAEAKKQAKAQATNEKITENSSAEKGI